MKMKEKQHQEYARWSSKRQTLHAVISICTRPATGCVTLPATVYKTLVLPRTLAQTVKRCGRRERKRRTWHLVHHCALPKDDHDVSLRLSG
jgi:hypothetical protein